MIAVRRALLLFLPLTLASSSPPISAHPGLTVSQQGTPLICSLAGGRLDTKEPEFSVVTGRDPVQTWYPTGRGNPWGDCDPGAGGCNKGSVLSVGMPVQRVFSMGDWTCAYVVHETGAGPAWIPTARLEAPPPNPTLSVKDWLGDWREVNGGAAVVVRVVNSAAGQKKISFAYDTVRHGFFWQVAVSDGANPLRMTDERCEATMTHLGQYLWITGSSGDFCGVISGLWRRSLQRPAAGGTPGRVSPSSQPSGPVTFAWMLDYEGKSTNQLIWDKRTASVIQTRVPSKISTRVLEGLGGPPNPVFIVGKRYVSLSACVPHYCPMRAFFWIDTLSGVGLAAHFNPETQTLTLGSNGLSGQQFPPEARKALVDWISDEELQPARLDDEKARPFDNWFKRVEFIGVKNTVAELNPFDFAPNKGFMPPPAGPGFDCAHASTAIERAICADTELALVDLNLFRLYDRIRRGHATTSARDQLLSFERAWLKNRDAECEKAPAVKACLATKYREQDQRLRDWTPTR